MATNGSKIITQNQDVWWFVNRSYDVMEELHKSQSASLSYMKSFDQLRLKKYIQELRSLLGVIQGLPELDQPESHPNLAHEMEAIPELPLVENHAINMLIQICKVMCFELQNSVSSRDSTRLNEFDLARVNAFVGKIEAILQNHIAVSTPSDWPESSPRYAISGPGKGGI